MTKIPGLFAPVKNKQKLMVVISLFMVVIQQQMVVFWGKRRWIGFWEGKTCFDIASIETFDSVA